MYFFCKRQIDFSQTEVNLIKLEVCQIEPHFKGKKMVIGFPKNVKIVSRNNAIYHFDTCGLSIFLQIHFLLNILLY